METQVENPTTRLYSQDGSCIEPSESIMNMGKPLPRVCKHCATVTIGGTLSYRYVVGEIWERAYFHPKCFKTFLKKLKGASS